MDGKTFITYGPDLGTLNGILHGPATAHTQPKRNILFDVLAVIGDRSPSVIFGLFWFWAERMAGREMFYMTTHV